MNRTFRFWLILGVALLIFPNDRPWALSIDVQEVFRGDEIVWFGATSDTLVVAWDDGTVNTWDWANQRQGVRFRSHVKVIGRRVWHVLSSCPQPKLAVYYDGTLEVHEISAGRELYQERGSNFPIGFWHEGQALALYYQDGLQNLFFDTKEAVLLPPVHVTTNSLPKKNRSFDTISLVGISEEGISVRYGDKGLTGIGPDGRILWETHFQNRNWQPALGSCCDPQWTLWFTDAPDATLYAYLIKNGSELWRIPRWKWRFIRAISSDGKIQVVSEGDSLVAMELPSTATIKLEGTSAGYDAFICGNGSHAACLPTLNEVGQTPDRDTILARKDHLICICNIKTGKIVARWQLVKF